MKYLKQVGFSLTEILIALGLLGGISLVTMKLMGDQSSNQNYLKSKSEIDKTVSLVAAQLADRKRCDAFVFGKRLGAAVTKISSKLPNGEEKILLKSASPFSAQTEEGAEEGGGSTVVSSGPVEYGDFYMDYNSMYIEPDPTISNLAHLVLRFRLKNSSFLKFQKEGDARNKTSQDYDPRSIVEKKIPIPIVRNFIKPVIIDSCGSQIGEAEARAREAFCTSLGEGFTWNVITSECVAREINCPIGQVVTEVTSLGDYKCGNASDHVILSNIFDLDSEKSCPNGFSLQQNSTTKKVQIRCN